MKKLNQKGFAHVLLVALIALVVLAAGVAGYYVWKRQSLNANAENWNWQLLTVKPYAHYQVEGRDVVNIDTTPPSYKPVMRACKQYVDAGPFGRYYKVNIIVTNVGVPNASTWRVVFDVFSTTNNYSKRTYPATGVSAYQYVPIDGYSKFYLEYNTTSTSDYFSAILGSASSIPVASINYC